jgi:hypothetical protein
MRRSVAARDPAVVSRRHPDPRARGGLDMRQRLHAALEARLCGGACHPAGDVVTSGGINAGFDCPDGQVRAVCRGGRGAAVHCRDGRHHGCPHVGSGPLERPLGQVP